jgi:hypothetical protein
MKFFEPLQYLGRWKKSKSINRKGRKENPQRSQRAGK